VWDLASGKELQTLAGHSGWVNGVAVTPDGKRAVSASENETLKVWDLESGKKLQTLAGHSDGVSGVAVTADRKRAVSASWEQTLPVLEERVRITGGERGDAGEAHFAKPAVL